VSDRDQPDDPEQQIALRLADAHQRMEKSVEALHRELMTVRTGRASPALLERLHVDYYGAPTPLQSIAGISVPQLTEERRKDLVKVIHRKAEEARVAVRNIRRDEVEHLRRVEKDGHVSKDEVASKLIDVQKITDQFIARIDDAIQRKEAEILEV